MPISAELTKSPVIMVAAGGAALVGAVYFFSKRAQSAQQAQTGTLPFSWDALANWLAANNNSSNGGQPAPAPNPTPAPAPGGGCLIQALCPQGQHWDTTQCRCVGSSPDPGQCPGGTCGGFSCGPGTQCVNGACVPCGGTGSLIPFKRVPATGGDNATGNNDVSAVEQPYQPVVGAYAAGGAGQPRLTGWSPALQYQLRYQLAYAIQQTGANDEGS